MLQGWLLMLPAGHQRPASQGSCWAAEGQKLPPGHSLTPLQESDASEAREVLLLPCLLLVVLEVWFAMESD